MPLGTRQNNDFTQFTMDVWNDKIFYQEKEFPAGFMAASVLPLSLLSLCFMKGDFIMQDKATNPGKTSRPEKNPLDAKTTYHIGNRSFVVEPVFKKESPDTLGSVLLRLMKSESEKL